MQIQRRLRNPGGALTWGLDNHEGVPVVLEGVFLVPKEVSGVIKEGPERSLAGFMGCSECLRDQSGGCKSSRAFHKLLGFYFYFHRPLKDDTGLSISNKMKRLFQFNSRQMIPYREGMNAYFNPRFHFYCKDDFNNSLNLLLVTIQIEMFTFFSTLKDPRQSFIHFYSPEKRGASLEDSLLFACSPPDKQLASL